MMSKRARREGHRDSIWIGYCGGRRSLRIKLFRGFRADTLTVGRSTHLRVNEFCKSVVITNLFRPILHDHFPIHKPTKLVREPLQDRWIDTIASRASLGRYAQNTSLRSQYSRFHQISSDLHILLTFSPLFPSTQEPTRDNSDKKGNNV